MRWTQLPVFLELNVLNNEIQFCICVLTIQYLPRNIPLGPGAPQPQSSVYLHPYSFVRGRSPCLGAAKEATPVQSLACWGEAFSIASEGEFRVMYTVGTEEQEQAEFTLTRTFHTFLSGSQEPTKDNDKTGRKKSFTSSDQPTPHYVQWPAHPTLA